MREKDERKRINFETSTSTNYCIELKNEIKKEEKTQKGIDCCIINKFLVDIPNFLGCFSQDQLSNIIIDCLPLSLVVNFDSSSEKGSHWIAIYLEKRSVEVFDSLGFQMDRWPSFPSHLIQFICRLSHSRQLLISGEIQPKNSSFCGFYCIYFIRARQKYTFNSILRHFSIFLSHNDSHLKQLLLKNKL